MDCKRCGKQMDPAARFCPLCGEVRGEAAVPPPYAAAARPSGQLVRSRSRRMIAGVCAGFADHYGWDLSLVRIVTVILTPTTGGAALFAYIAAWIIIPDGQYALPFGAPPPPVPPTSAAASSTATSTEGTAI